MVIIIITTYKFPPQIVVLHCLSSTDVRGPKWCGSREVRRAADGVVQGRDRGLGGGHGFPSIRRSPLAFAGHGGGRPHGCSHVPGSARRESLRSTYYHSRPSTV
jgi:hypothetical protein